MLWHLYFRYFIKLTIFFEMWKFRQKIELVSISWKIKIPLGKSVGHHIWVIQIHMGEE